MSAIVHGWRDTLRRSRYNYIMKSLRCTSFETEAGLSVSQSPTPQPGPHEVVVEVAAVAIAFVDRLIVTGRYQVVPALPYVPGSLAAGVISAVGTEVTDREAGQRVVLNRAKTGTWATHALVDSALTVPIPDGVDNASAAAALEAYGTAIYALEHRVAVQPGQTMLVLGAGGAVGAAFIELAAAAGLQTIAVTSNAAISYANGTPELIIDRTTDDLRAKMKASFERGVDYVVDPVGGDLAVLALRSLGFRGRYLVVGFASGVIPQLPINHVLLQEREIIGVDWGDYVRTRPAAAAQSLTAVMNRLADGSLPLPKTKTVTFEQLVTHLHQSATEGGLIRTVLIPR